MIYNNSTETNIDVMADLKTFLTINWILILITYLIIYLLT